MRAYQAEGPADIEEALGRVIRADCATVSIALGDPSDPESARLAAAAAKLGAIVRINAPGSVAFGVISSLQRDRANIEGDPMGGGVVEVSLMGEAERSSCGAIGRFKRGVTIYPTLGAAATRARRRDLVNIFRIDEANAMSVGGVFQDATIPAQVRVNELLAKHFAVLGATGAGKSCTVALLAHAILKQCPNAHMLLLDPHAEYAAAFGDQAEVIGHRDLRIPYWALCFDELVEVLFPNRRDLGDQIEALADLVRQAKAMYNAPSGRDGAAQPRRRVADVAQFSEDAPVPYRLADLIRLIDERIGSLEHQSDLILYRRLRNRIDVRVRDERYAFVFGAAAAKTTLADMLSRLFRVPVKGKPLAILELAGLPSEVLGVVVCVVSRLAFEFGLRAGGSVPITLICEEAHNYLPADSDTGFAPARRALGRIAKEGRKYGVSLGIVTQRPAELDATVLSQCNTIIAMRLTNDRDQAIVQSAVSDTAAGLVPLLSALVSGEAVVFGDGFALPMRMRFDELDAAKRPASASADFAMRWRLDDADADLAAEVAHRFARNEFAPVILDADQPVAAAEPEEGKPMFGSKRGASANGVKHDRRAPSSPR